MSMMIPEFTKNNECNTNNCILVSVICSAYPSKNWDYLPKNNNSIPWLAGLLSALRGMDQGCSFLRRIFTQSNLELKDNPSILKYDIPWRSDPTIFSMKFSSMKIDNVLPALMHSVSNVIFKTRSWLLLLIRLPNFITTSKSSRFKIIPLEKILNHLNLTLESVDLTYW